MIDGAAGSFRGHHYSALVDHIVNVADVVVSLSLQLWCSLKPDQHNFNVLGNVESPAASDENKAASWFRIVKVSTLLQLRPFQTIS